MIKPMFSAVAFVTAFGCVGAIFAATPLSLVENGRPQAAFAIPSGLSAAEAKAVADDLVRFNVHLRQITGTELPTNGTANGSIEIVLRPITSLMTRFDWRLTYPTPRTLRIEATTTSLFTALRQILEDGCDARFLGTERCMFQFEPRTDVMMSGEAKSAPKNGYRLYRNIWWMPGHEREMGLSDDRLFQYSHGLPYLAFPFWTYQAKGWPEGVLPEHKGRRLVKAPELVNRWQPCFSDPRAAEVAVRNIREFLSNNPDTKSISLGVNDNGGYCECAACRKLDANAEKSVLSNDPVNHSPSYYTFVNRVAAALEKDHPDLKIGLLAYIGTIMPPSLPVHRNVVPVLTFDLLAASQEESVFQAQQDVLRRWGEKVPVIGTWDYCWGRTYYLPRVNFKKQAERLKFLHAHGGEAYFGENSSIQDMSDGPKPYLTARLLENADADPEAILTEWYERFAGKAAAPLLRNVYDRCSAYWYTDAMRRSAQYKGRAWTYEGPTKGHLFALTPGFTRALVKDIEKVGRLAVTPGEKRRAETLLRHFEMLDCHATFQGFGYCESESGEFASAAKAVEAVDNLVRRADELLDAWNRSTAYFRNADFDGKGADAYVRKNFIVFNLTQLVSALVARASAYADDPAVIAALRRLAAVGRLPKAVRTLAAHAGEPAENLFDNPGFRQPPAPATIRTTLAWEITDEITFRGEKTLKVYPGRADGAPNPGDIVLINVPALTLCQALPQGLYKGAVSIFCPTAGKGVDVQFWKQGKNRQGKIDDREWEYVSYAPLKQGTWRTFAKVNDVTEKCTGLGIKLRLTENFGPDDCLYIGGVEFSKGD